MWYFGIGSPPEIRTQNWVARFRPLAQKKKVNYEGASGRLDFDSFGDVTPDFGVYVIEKGLLVRRDVVSL